MRTPLLISVLSVQFLLSLGQKDLLICPKNWTVVPVPGAPPGPKLPDQYSVVIECNFMETNTTIEFKEYYDGPGRAVAMYQTSFNIDVTAIFNYTTNELLTIMPKAEICKVSTISDSSYDFLFGHKTGQGDSHISMYSVMGALRFNTTTPEQYLGQETIRGMLADHWTGCIYMASHNATVTVDWYFTAYNSWNTSSKWNQIPIVCQISGNVWKGNNRTEINHYYLFSEFKPGPPKKSKFQTPATIVCPGRVSQKSLPTMPPVFIFPSEILDPQMKTIGRTMEQYNYGMKLFYYSESVVEGMQTYDILDDFNREISYSIGRSDGHCSTDRIDPNGLDSRPGGPNGAPRMRNASEFFYFNSRYEYEGIKNYRGISSYAYINRQKDSQNQWSVFEWYFATEEHYQVDQTTLIQGMPVGVYSTTGDEIKIYNSHGFSEQGIDVWTYGERLYKCFDYNHRAEYAFLLPGDYQSVVLGDIKNFKLMMLISIQALINISPVRISNFRLDYDENNHIIVAFTLLDKAPSMGDYGLTPEPSLNDAVKILNRKISSGSLTFNSDSGKILTASRYSLMTPLPSTAPTYSPGAMAALGVVMLLLFFIVGFGVLYFIYRRNGGGFKSERFDNEKVISSDA